MFPLAVMYEPCHGLPLLSTGRAPAPATMGVGSRGLRTRRVGAQRMTASEPQSSRATRRQFLLGGAVATAGAAARAGACR